MAEKETRHQAYLTVYFCGSENCPPRHAYGRQCALTIFSM